MDYGDKSTLPQSYVLHSTLTSVQGSPASREIMSKREWDYALHIKGVTFNTLGLARLADYMKEFALLLGEDARPTFAGAVKGSVVLRARDRSEYPVLTKSRVRQAAANTEAPGHNAYEKISSLMRRDGARGQIVDRSDNVLATFTPRIPANDDMQEIVISDEGELDGIVVGVSGADDTAHIRLQEASGSIHSITVRDMTLARELATRFRANTVRLHVHGTWKRTAAGLWEPHALYGDRFEDLNQSDAHETFLELAAIPGNGWATTEDADEVWKRIRGIDDSRA